MKHIYLILFAFIYSEQLSAQYFKFDIPGADATYVTGINDSANVCGYYTKNGTNRGFFFNGTTIDTFEITLSDHTYPRGINNKNLIVGHHVYQGTTDYDVFVYNANTHNDMLANITSIIGYDPVFAGGITDDTTVVGDYKFMQSSQANRRTWIAYLGYGFNAVNYNILQYGSLPTYAEGINNQKTRVGYVIDGSFSWGWVKTATGTIDTFKIPTSIKTRFTGISNNNYICGYYNNSKGFYFLLGPNNNITQYNKVEIPGAIAVFPMGINNKRQLCGYYTDAQGNTHGFILRGYDIGFRPDKHGWTKGNNLIDMWSYMFIEQGPIDYTKDPYLNDGSSFMEDPTGKVSQLKLINENYAFPDWPLFVNAYSEDSCYINTPAGKLTKAKQLGYWYNMLPSYINQNNNTFGWNGACSGFTYTSYFTYKDIAFYQSRFPNASVQVKNHYGQTMITPRIKSVNTFQIFQDGKKQIDWLYNPSNGTVPKTPNETLALLKQRMLDTSNYCGISIYKLDPNTGKSAGHSMLPYKITPGSVGYERIYVYDSNHPGDTTRYISVNTDAANGGSWQYQMNIGDTWNGEGWGLILDYEMDMNRNPAIVPIQTEESFASRSGNSFSSIYLEKNAKTTFSNTTGEMAEVSANSLSNTFTNGHFHVPATSNLIQPTEFICYDSDWTARIEECTDSIASLVVMEDRYFISMNVFNVTPAQSNKFHYLNQQLNFNNSDNITKKIKVNCGIDYNGSSYQYKVSNLNVAAQDSVGATVINNNQLKIVNYGNSTNYSVDIFFISTSDVTTFSNNTINFASDATHIIAPYFDNLSGNGIAIFVDNGSNGNFDDTLFVSNQALPKLKLGTNFLNIPYQNGSYSVPFGNIGAGTLNWQIESLSPWITLTGSASGTEDAQINFNADNNGGNYRLGYVKVNSNDPNKPYDTLTIAQDGLTAYQEINTVQQIESYPNPTYGVLYVKIPENARITDISLISMDGRSFSITELNTEGLSGIHRFDMQGLHTGIYILRVSFNNETYYDKIIKY